MKLTENSMRVLERRYLRKDEYGRTIESPEEMLWRVAGWVALAESPDRREYWTNEFYKVMDDLDFLPNSPTLMNAGKERGLLSACFVIPIEDSIDGIFNALRWAALVSKEGGGTGFSFSRLRPKGDLVKSTCGVASGPLSFMELFNHTTEVVMQGGMRRGANMGVLNVDHPDIIDFIKAKTDNDKFTNFNISVGITNDFMKAVEADQDWNLVNPRNGQIVKTVKAKELFDLIVDCAWRTGDPGLLFLDTINDNNPVPNCGRIESSNPCVTGDTIVITSNGDKRIDEITTNDFVLTYNVEENVLRYEKVVWCGLTRKNADVIEIELENGITLKLTPDHKVYTQNRGYVEASRLSENDELLINMLVNNITTSTIRKIKNVSNEDVYDITVKRNHNFFANNVLVHNCGEQPLIPFESCNLGSINLLNFYKDNGIDWNRLKDIIRIAVRFLDDVIDVNYYPISQIEETTKKTRKIGLGIMGWADLLYKLGIPYNSQKALSLAEKVMRFITETGREESCALAEERGVFPAWEGSIWEKRGIKVRNATITTIAPTGTISLVAGVSSGIEPNFALAYRRKAFAKESQGEETLVYVNPILIDRLKNLNLYTENMINQIIEKGSLQHIDGIPESIKEIFVTAHDIAPEWHIKMQAAFQRYTDNAVSKTINLPSNATKEAVANAFMLAYGLNCKGITVFRDGCKGEQVLNVGAKEPVVAKPSKKDRPNMLSGNTLKISTSYGNLYLTLNVDENGNPFEIFATLGKSGKDTQAHTEAIGRLVSLALRSGISINDVIRQLKGIGGSTQVLDENLFTLILSIPDAIAKGLEMLINGEINNHELIKGDVCPTCGAPLIYEEGCIRCSSCDFSKCG